MLFRRAAIYDDTEEKTFIVRAAFYTQTALMQTKQRPF